MGEYITVNGHDVKLGTCEDLYYARLGQLRELSGAGKLPGNREVSEYLNPSHGWRYRFPFPDEDAIELGSFEDYGRELVIQLDRIDYGMLDNFKHDEKWHSNAPKGGGYNVNVQTPCPQSRDFDWMFIQQPDNTLKRLSSSGLTWRIVGITQQKQVEGQVWTVISCPYCGSKRRLPQDEATKLVHSIKVGYITCHGVTEREKTYYQAVCERILAGYQSPVTA